MQTALQIFLSRTKTVSNPLKGNPLEFVLQIKEKMPNIEKKSFRICTSNQEKST
jgi:hypothetical protein